MTKSRLSEVAKQNITDRASKLANGLLPPLPAVVTPVHQSKQDPPATQVDEPTPVATADTDQSPETELATPVVGEEPPTAEAARVAKSRTERSRKSASSIDLTELVTQPAPADLRCTKMIMVTEEHHKLLRDLSYLHGKPMTVVLHNLLEPARQTFERDKQKGN
ncbi:hypothetical protein GCM10023189_32590 [Nibrella saemangeumensis]|uniref:Uncharacterized protein n=1 Tax=Nibrella saemangeumensis TaxID=1084526 RepID=A0ABP8N4R7_9BACT